MGPEGRLFFGTFPSEVRPEHVTAEALALLAGAGSASAQTATCTNAGATTAQKWKKWESNR